MRRTSIVAVFFVAVTVAVAAQAPSFDVASVRLSTSSRVGADWVFLPGGQFTATNTPALELIGAAYNIPTYRIVGGPEWINEDAFDVQARGNANVAVDEIRRMLRTLLADRFELRVRTESRALPIYALVLARNDGRMGPQLRTASPDACVDRGQLPVGVPAGGLPSCRRLLGNPGRLSGRSVPLALLTTRLSESTRRVVIDRTGLAGLFDIDLQWGLTEAEHGALLQQIPAGITPPAFDPSRPSLFTALEEQLGLRLESTTGPVDVIVIESIARPTAN